MKSLTGGLVVSLLLLGCAEKEPPPVSASGETLFNHHCAACHRAGGTGNFLKGIPANVLTQMDEDQVVDLIRYGEASKPEMPSFPQLSRPQSERIVEHLFRLRDDLVGREEEG